MAKSASLVTSLTHSSTFSPTYSLRNDLDPRAAPKCLWPSVVTLIAFYPYISYTVYSLFSRNTILFLLFIAVY